MTERTAVTIPSSNSAPATMEKLLMTLTNPARPDSIPSAPSAPPDLSARWDTEPLDLSAYLQRIGYSGPLTPTLDTLRALQHAHLEAIPFEGLSPYLGLAVPLDIALLQDKLVRGARGGYCHEQNILFGTVLARLGFHVTGRSARMLMGADENIVTARGHTILSVLLEDVDYHVDVGIGNVGPRGPIPLIEGARVDTGRWQYRMDRSELGHWVLRYRRPRQGDWFSVIQFDESTHYRSDFANDNIIAGTDASSPFTQQPIVAYNGADVRRSLAGLTLTTYLPDGGTESEILTPEEVPGTLRALFGVALNRREEGAMVDALRQWTAPGPEAAPHGQ